jgi:hypothetical protein
VKAFPNMAGQQGMDLRDYFAVKAMQAMICDPTVNNAMEDEGVDYADATAYLAYLVADAMMKAREEKKDDHV